MAGKALMALLKGGMPSKKRTPPEFADEGPPDDEEERGGTSGGEPEGPDADGAEDPEAGPPSSERPGGMHDHAEMALDDLADIAGISPEDRADFGSALDAYVSARIADALAEHGGDEPEEEPEPEEEEPSPDEE